VSTLTQTLASLRRRPMRTFLTALGTALGIATIVALLAVAGGAQQSGNKFLDLGASDLGVFQANAADPTTSVLPLSLVRSFKRTPGIANATPLILLVEDVHADPGAIVFGARAHSFLSKRFVFTSGHMFTAPNQIVVGNTLMQQLHLRLGQQLKVAQRMMTVVGTYHLGVSNYDSGAMVPLATAQRISGRQGEATTIVVKLGVGTKPAAAKQALNRRFHGLLILGSGDESVRAGANGQLLAKAALVIAVLAILIGGIGVTNTMMMAVVERRSEFALLSAVGWSGPQIAVRVLAEGVVTSLLGAAIGLLLGTLGAQVLVNVLGAGAFVSPDITAWTLGRGLLVGVLLGVLGGLYPAWSAAHVSPAAVLAER
jgi:putative ABC transport system permease protein